MLEDKPKHIGIEQLQGFVDNIVNGIIDGVEAKEPVEGGSVDLSSITSRLDDLENPFLSIKHVHPIVVSELDDSVQRWSEKGNIIAWVAFSDKATNDPTFAGVLVSIATMLDNQETSIFNGVYIRVTQMLFTGSDIFTRASEYQYAEWITDTTNMPDWKRITPGNNVLLSDTLGEEWDTASFVDASGYSSLILEFIDWSKSNGARIEVPFVHGITSNANVIVHGLGSRYRMVHIEGPEGHLSIAPMTGANTNSGDADINKIKLYRVIGVC